MDYLAFRYTKLNYKVPINYNTTVKRADVDDIEKRLGGYKGASFLSGGLDSSLLAAINRPEMCYIASFESGEDETDWAVKVARHLDLKLTSVPITRERYLSTLEYLIRQKGDGLHPNEPCLYLVAKQAKADGFNNILSGEGADDLFGGYTDLLINEDKYMATKETFLQR